MESIAKEQSLSHWKGNSTIDKNLIKKYAAKGIAGSVQIIDCVNRPSFPTYVQTPSKNYNQFTAKIAFPLINFGGMLAPMYNTIIGEIHNIGVITAIKVLDIKFPQSYLSKFPGPKFGIDGIRDILKDYESPIFIGPVKPCVGLTPKQFAETAYSVLKGGFHIVKDDELLVETKYSPFRQRIQETMRIVKKVEDETNRKKMYFAHIGGDLTNIQKYYDIAEEEGVDGVMISPAINGLDSIKWINGNIPIIAHNTLLYASSRHPIFGVQFHVWEKLQRICGADIILNPAPFGSFHIMDIDEHLLNVKACLGKLGYFKSVFPAFSGSQSPKSLVAHFNLIKTTNFIIVSGAAAYGHPQGGQAGAKSFIQAWKAIKQGITLEKYAESHPELKISLDNFGKLIN